WDTVVTTHTSQTSRPFFLTNQALYPWPLRVSQDLTWDSFPSFFLLHSDTRSTIGLPVGSIIGIAVGVLVGLALTVALGCFLLRIRTGRASGWSDLRELWGPASTPRPAPASSSTSPDSLPSPTTAIPIYQFPELCDVSQCDCLSRSGFTQLLGPLFLQVLFSVHTFFLFLVSSGT
uniref:Uncharacterized protein n=1 Tax=Ailuropoda melanoleuca TaxID=9646 RepID=A0A7N5PB06_AILME